MRIYSIRGTRIYKKVKKSKEVVFGFVRNTPQARAAINHIKEYGNPDKISMSTLHWEAEDIESGKDGMIAWLMLWCPDVANTKELIQEILEEV